tara:strand:- start:58 stop:246 length:189 start_codon:yes stop_codon:yes gene_type:complete
MGWLAQDKDPEWPVDLFTTEFQLDPSTTALLVIDMQGSDDKLIPIAKLAVSIRRLSRIGIRG